jgi:shikimate kinase
MPKEMFTSHPTIGPQLDANNKRDTINASSVAMAQAMYKVMERRKAEAALEGTPSGSGVSAAASAQRWGRSNSLSSVEPPPGMYLGNVQEAAQRLAKERLAKIQTENEEFAYRNYYGASAGGNKLQKRDSLLSRTGSMFNRRRASSDASLEDEEEARRIRGQMSLFSSNLSGVDEKKRSADREALLAVARRNVDKNLHDMDEAVYTKTGKATPAMMQEWHVKAQAQAERQSMARAEANPQGRIDIGGGKYMDQSEIDAIAQRKVQPLIDEVERKAVEQRAREAEMRLDEQQRKNEAEREREREREAKEHEKHLKGELSPGPSQSVGVRTS